MPNFYIDTQFQDNFSGFPTTKSSTGEIVARDEGGYKAVVNGPGVFEVFVEGVLKIKRSVGSERVDVLLDEVFPLGAPEKVGTAVTFSLRQSDQSVNPVEQHYRFVQGVDFFAFEIALRQAQELTRQKAEAQREGVSRLARIAKDSLNDIKGLVDATTYFSNLSNALTGRGYRNLAGVLSGQGEYAINTANEAFDILFEPAVRGFLLTLPNPNWFHRVVLQAASKQEEPLPLKMASVDAFLAELRQTDAGRLIAEHSNGVFRHGTDREFALLVRSGALTQEPSEDGRPGALHLNPAFAPADKLLEFATWGFVDWVEQDYNK